MISSAVPYLLGTERFGGAVTPHSSPSNVSGSSSPPSNIRRTLFCHIGWPFLKLDKRASQSVLCHQFLQSYGCSKNVLILYFCGSTRISTRDLTLRDHCIGVLSLTKRHWSSVSIWIKIHSHRLLMCNSRKFLIPKLEHCKLIYEKSSLQ